MTDCFCCLSPRPLRLFDNCVMESNEISEQIVDVASGVHTNPSLDLTAIGRNEGVRAEGAEKTAGMNFR